jgi:3-deoxy-D-manno-octulosonic-acid transferase
MHGGLLFNHFTQNFGKVEPASICFLILHSMILFYNLFRFVYFGGIRLAARWSTKAKLWTEGRKNWQQFLRQQPQSTGTNVTVWMHCASLGEFEQGRPVLEKIKTTYPNVRVILTFFSPSGYEVRKGYRGADVIMYLPDDSKENAVTFLDLVQPALAIFVKYEFWHFYLTELKKRGIETILVSGIFRDTQPFFQWWGGFHKNMLQQFSHLFVQNQSSASLLASIHIQNNVTVCGDTRFDRVIEAAQQWQPISSIDHVIDPNKKVLVAGSTWKDDE